MPISAWSTTPASNNSSPPNGAPEGMTPSSVNDVMRQQMADHKTQWLDAEWFNHGDTVSRASATTFKIASDVTSQYLANRRIKCLDGSTLYGTVTTSSYSAPDTTITVSLDSGSLTSSLSAVALGIVKPTNRSIPDTLFAGLPVKDSNGNELIEFSATASAVNQIRISNAIASNAPIVEAAGDDTNIDLTIKAKGSGKVKLGTALLKFPNADGTANQVLKTDGAGVLSFADAASGAVPVRQTVLTGSVDANGVANFLSAGTGLAVNLAATTVPVRVAFAAGYTSTGEVNYIGNITADASSAWSSLTASSTLYLYIDYNSGTGALTYGFTTLAPTYGYGSTKSTTNGQHTFRIDEMKMYVGDGSAANAVNRVFIGECVTSGVAVTSITTYQIQAKASFTQATLAAGTQYTFSHNIGYKDLILNQYLECTSAELGFSVGDRVYNSTDGNSGTASAWYGLLATTTYKTVILTTGTSGIGIIRRDNGVPSNYTIANWDAGVHVKRAW